MSVEERIRCENFHVVKGIMYQCNGVPIPSEAIMLTDGFYRMGDEDIWVCDFHRFFDLTRYELG